MTTPSTTFTEMVSTTSRNFGTTVADAVSKHNALYNRLVKNGRVKKEVGGGYEIQRPIAYAENTTYQRYSGYDTLNIQASDVLTSTKWDWCQAAIHVTASGRELRMNSSKERMVNLVKERKKVAMDTAANNMSIDLYSSGALANQIGGLGLIIQNNGQGTVGGIVSDDWTFWRNQVKEAAGTNTISSSTIESEMKALWLLTVRNSDKPDLIVATHDFYTMYETSRDSKLQYRNNDVPDTFESVKFKGADVIFDLNDNFSATGEKMYFLNTKYLEFVVHPDANWSVEADKISVNQDAVVIPMLFMGQLVCTNRARQGVLIDAA